MKTCLYEFYAFAKINQLYTTQSTLATQYTLQPKANDANILQLSWNSA